MRPEMRSGFGKYRNVDLDGFQHDYLLEIQPLKLQNTARFSLYGKRHDEILKEDVYHEVLETNSYLKLRMNLDLLGISEISYIERCVMMDWKSSAFCIYFKRSN